MHTLHAPATPRAEDGTVRKRLTRTLDTPVAGSEMTLKRLNATTSSTPTSFPQQQLGDPRQGLAGIARLSFWYSNK